jgi:hypothetical protein
MAVRHHREQAPGKKQARSQPWLRGARHRGVQLTAQDGILCAFSALLVELQIDTWTTLAVLRNERCYHGFHDHRRATNAQNARRALRERSRPFAHGLTVGQKVPAPLQQILAALRELDSPAGAVEEAQAERRLEFGNPTRQSGLRDVKRVCGSGKPLQVRDGYERSKKAEIHVMRHVH